MNLVAIMGSPRKGSATDRLVDRAIEGACSACKDIHPKKIVLIDKNISYCKGCLVCRDSPVDLPVGRCSQSDDMDEIITDLLEADLLIFGTPLRMGYITSILATFFERICWRFSKPTGKALTIRGVPEPRSNKKRRSITIITNSIVPPLYRMFCDDASSHIKRAARDALGAKTIGDLYAGDIEHRGVERYLDKAFKLGTKLPPSSGGVT